MGIKTKLIVSNKKRGQMKIQQMAFMIIAVFIFFLLVALFVLRYSIKDLHNDVNTLNKEQAISSLEVLTNMPEFTCGSGRSLCLDEDKIRIMTGNFSRNYEYFWPVASIKVYKIYPKPTTEIPCPGMGCNYYLIYDNTQKDSQEYSTYVNLCKKIRTNGYITETCDIAKLVVGMKKKDAN